MADDGLWSPDGGRMQSHLQRTVDIRSRSVSRGFSYSELGLVVKRYYPDETGNRHGIVTDYDVFLPRHQVTLRNVPMLTPYQGANGGLQITLTPASGVPDMADPVAGWRELMDSDGDLVTVAYIGGKWPVIEACVNHVRAQDAHAADWHTGSADGEVYALTYHGTRARIDQDGNVELHLEDLPAHDRKVTVVVGTAPFLTVTQDAGTGAVRVEVGSGALEKTVLGETLRTWLNAALPTSSPAHHVHAYVSPGGPAMTGEPSNIAGVPMVEFPSTGLTAKLKVEP